MKTWFSLGFPPSLPCLPSLISLYSLREEVFHPRLSIEYTAKALIRLRKCHIAGFFMSWLIFLIMLSVGDCFLGCKTIPYFKLEMLFRLLTCCCFSLFCIFRILLSYVLCLECYGLFVCFCLCVLFTFKAASQIEKHISIGFPQLDFLENNIHVYSYCIIDKTSNMYSNVTTNIAYYKLILYIVVSK